MMFSTEAKLRAEIEQVWMLLNAERAVAASQAERIRVLWEALQDMVIANEQHSLLRVADVLKQARAALEATK